jgi:hypothetical protein
LSKPRQFALAGLNSSGHAQLLSMKRPHRPFELLHRVTLIETFKPTPTGGRLQIYRGVWRVRNSFGVSWPETVTRPPNTHHLLQNEEVKNCYTAYDILQKEEEAPERCIGSQNECPQGFSARLGFLQTCSNSINRNSRRNLWAIS